MITGPEDANAAASAFVAEQPAGPAVDKMQPAAGGAGYRLVFVLMRDRPVGPVLHVQMGSGANEDQVHGALVGRSAELDHDLAQGCASAGIRIAADRFCAIGRARGPILTFASLLSGHFREC